MKRVISFSIFVLILMMALTSLCSCQEERCYHCSASNYGVRMVKKEYGEEQYYVCKDCAELKVTSGFDVAVQCIEALRLQWYSIRPETCEANTTRREPNITAKPTPKAMRWSSLLRLAVTLATGE